MEEFKNWGPWEVELSKRSHEVLGPALGAELAPQYTPLVNLNICLPEQAKAVEHCRNVNYTMFEVDRIPQNWVSALKAMDEVWVPTDYNRWLFTRSGVPQKKLSVLPIGYDPAVYHPFVPALPLTCEGKNVLDFPIRIVAICEVTNRKNFWGLLHTFYQVAALVGVDKCCLILKAANYSQQLSLREQVDEFRRERLADGSAQDLPYNVFNYLPLLPEEVHPQFVKMGTHYLSTSLGEGWDLTALQAAALGLHLFVPHHSAYSCWLDNSVCTMLPVAQKQAAFQAGALTRLYENANWVAFDMPASVQIIASALLDPSLIEEKKARMRSYIQQFQWSKLLGQYLEALHLA